MRLFAAALLALAISCCAFGQTYNIQTFAGNGTPGYSGDGGPATGAELNYPWRAAVDATGSLYIGDTGNQRIRKVANGAITTVVGTGTQGYSGDNGTALNARLNQPMGVAVDFAGNIYIDDHSNNVIRRVSNGVITTVAGNGTQGSSGDNGPATNAELNYPEGIAVDGLGNLYIADSGNNRVRKVSNGVITTVAGSGSAGFSGDNGPAISAALNFPQGVVVDAAGNLYIADSNNHRIREVMNGVIITVAGGANTVGDNGPATSAGLGATDVAIDSAGNLYIADGYASIRKVSNGVITTIAGTGTQGSSGEGGPATSVQLSTPQGVVVDAAGNVYIADKSHQRIRVLTPSGSACSVSVAPLALSAAASGGPLTVTIQASSSSCAWAVQSLPAWITFSGNVVGTGTGSITLSVAANSGAARTATVSVAGLLVQVNQQGGYVSCAYALSPSSQAFPAAGGAGSLSVTTTSGCSWTASSNVTWVTITGGTSGMGNGTVTYEVAANTGAAQSGNLTVAGLPFTVEQSGAVTGPANIAGNWHFSGQSSIYGLSFSVTGQIAQSGNNVSGQLAVSGTPCATSAVLSGTLSNTGVIAMNLNENGQVVAFSGTLSSDGNSATGTYAAPAGGCTNGDKGTWQGQRVVSGALVFAGSMAQLASGGLWNTTITLVNTGAATAQAQLNFFDDNGNTLLLPMTFPQTPSTTPLLASTLDQTIGAGAELVIQTAGTAGQTTVEGWAQLLANGNISGSAVFAWTPAAGTQEAVVPVETRNPSAFVLPFDYTGGYATGVALANLTNQAVSIPVVLRDSTGASLGTAAPIQLPAYAHTSFMLATNYPAVAGQLGTLELDTPSGGQISALGIRATPSGAITSIPAIAK